MIVFTAFRAVNMNLLTAFGAFPGIDGANYSNGDVDSYRIEADGGAPAIDVTGTGFDYFPSGLPFNGTVQTLTVQNDAVLNTYRFSGLAKAAADLNAGLGAGGDALLDEFLNVNNQINGSSFGDILNGQDGIDLIKGNLGNDTLLGGNQNDILIGGLGRDNENGGPGADRLDFNAVAESRPGAALRDTVNGFTHADFIDVGTIDANTTAPGNQAFVNIGNATFAAHAGTGEIRHAGAGLFQFNTDADNAPEMEIKFIGGLPNAGDFML